MDINLKQEFVELLNDEDIDGIGHWIVLRIFDKSKYSKYWNEVTKETVGGPMYEFSDRVMRSYSRPARRGILGAQGLSTIEAGMLEDKLDVFYIMHDISVDEGDELFELDYDGLAEPILVYTATEENKDAGRVRPNKRFKILKVEDYRANSGKIEYKAIYAEKTMLRI